MTRAAVLATDYAALLSHSPTQAQDAAGLPYMQAVTRLSHDGRDRETVLVILPSEDAGAGYAQLWATFWLYPRQVTVSFDLAAANFATQDAVLEVALGGVRDLPPPAGYISESSTKYADGTVSVVHRRRG